MLQLHPRLKCRNEAGQADPEAGADTVKRARGSCRCHWLMQRLRIAGVWRGSAGGAHEQCTRKRVHADVRRQG